jgi:hypothetical protein
MFSININTESKTRSCVSAREKYIIFWRFWGDMTRETIGLLEIQIMKFR